MHAVDNLHLKDKIVAPNLSAVSLADALNLSAVSLADEPNALNALNDEINQMDLPREIDASHNGVYFTGAKFIRRQYGGQTKSTR